MSDTNTLKLEPEPINTVGKGSVEAIDDKVEEVPPQDQDVDVRIEPNRNVRYQRPVDLNRVATKLRFQESAKMSQWQVRLINICNMINERLSPGLKSLEAIGEELTFQVVECKSGQSDNLIGAWLMTIRLAIGKIQFPPGHNDTVAKECWEKLSALAEMAVRAIQTHKKMYKPTVAQLEFIHNKYAKYVQMVGRPLITDSPTEVVITDVGSRNSREPSIPDNYIPGICSASVAVFERDIILVHDQDRQAPIFHIKESEGVGNYSRCIEVLKLFIEQTTGMVKRSHEKMLSAEAEQEPMPQFLRTEMTNLLGLLIKYDKAHRLQERSCSTQLKITMRSLNDTIRTFLNHVEALKLIYVWVLTAVEACFDKIKESWPNINFTAEPFYRDKHKKLLDPKRNPWWHPKRFLSSQKLTFWEDICENVGKFEKFFRGWGIGAMQLINLRVSIPTDLSSLLFVEHEKKEFDYSESPGSESGYQIKSYYSDVFHIEEQMGAPSKGRRHHLSHTNTSFEEIELNLDEHADHPVLEYNDLFPLASPDTSETSEEETKTDVTSKLYSPTFSIASTVKPVNKPGKVISSTSEIKGGHVSIVALGNVSVQSDPKTVKEVLDVISSISKIKSDHTSISALPNITVTENAEHDKEVVKVVSPACKTESGHTSIVASHIVSVTSIAQPIKKETDIISPVSEAISEPSIIASPTVSILSTAKPAKEVVEIVSPACKTKSGHTSIVAPHIASVASIAKPIKKSVDIISPVSEAISEPSIIASASPTVSIVSTSKPAKEVVEVIPLASERSGHNLGLASPPVSVTSTVRSKSFKKPVKVISPVSETNTDLASMIASASLSSMLNNVKAAKKPGEIISDPESETDLLTSGYDRNRSVDGDGDDVTVAMSLDSLK